MKIINKLTDKLISQRYKTKDPTLIIFVTLLLVAGFTLINGNFIDKYNLISLGQNIAPYAIMSLGVLMPISIGGTDLSVGALCVGSAVVAGWLYRMGMPLFGVIPVMLLFGALIGFINGVLISKNKLQPFIVTLGTMMFVRGFTAILSGSPTVLFPTGCWYNYFFSSYKGFPISFIWIVLFAVIIYFIYRKTKIGRYMVSIGSCEKATRLSGIDVEKYKIICYTLSGLMAGIAGIFWSASFATVTAATGNGMELDAIAGVYIGGTSASGGNANVFGAVIGSIMLVVLRSGLNFSLAKLNVPINSTYVTYVISGIIIIIALYAEVRKNNKNKIPNVKKQKILAAARCIGIIVLSLLIVFEFLFFKNTQDAGTAEATSKTVCLVMKSEGNDFWNSVADGAEAAGKDNGYTVICRGCESEDSSFLPKQLEIAQTLMTENPAGLAVATIADGFTDTLKEAYRRNIPVIQYDSGLYAKDFDEISASEENPLRSYVKADNYKNSELAAEKTFPAIRDDIANSDSYVVGIIQHENSATAKDRADGFKDKLMELAEADSRTKGKCRVLVEVKQSEKNNAYKEALEYLYEKESKFIFMTSESVENQVSDAIDAVDGKYSGLKFAGYDVGSKIIEWIDNGKDAEIIGAVSQNPYKLGYLTAEALIRLSKGEKPEEEIVVPGEWCSKETIGDFR